MPRRAEYRVPFDTFHFSPHQIHACAALELAFGSFTQSIHKQIMPMNRMIDEHGWSFVAVGCMLEYLRPLTFHTAGDWLSVDGTMVLRGGGKLAEHRCNLVNDEGRERPVVVVRSLWRPVKLSGTAELAGLPQPADGWLAGHFAEDERDDSAIAREMQPALERLAKEFEVVAQGEYATTVSRDECETADQWKFASLARYVARSRESMALDSESEIAREGLARPLQRMVAELRGPLYFSSTVRVHTDILRRGDELVFRHLVTNHTPTCGELPCATVLESFPLRGSS